MRKKKRGLHRFLAVLGPGLITGAADDDPSGIATYSVAGAQLGTTMLWTAFVTWPLMAAVQMMCASIGMVSGCGPAAAMRKKFPRSLVILAALALLAANTVNIGADLAGMADAAQMLTGINSHLYVVFFGVAISAATVWLRYSQIANFSTASLILGVTAATPDGSGIMIAGIAGVVAGSTSMAVHGASWHPLRARSRGPRTLMMIAAREL